MPFSSASSLPPSFRSDLSHGTPESKSARRLLRRRQPPSVHCDSPSASPSSSPCRRRRGSPQQHLDAMDVERRDTGELPCLPGAASATAVLEGAARQAVDLIQGLIKDVAQAATVPKAELPRPSRETEVRNGAAVAAALKTARQAAASQYLQVAAPDSEADAAAAAAMVYTSSFNGDAAAASLIGTVNSCDRISAQQRQAVMKFCEALSEAATGPGGTCMAPDCVQMPRLMAALHSANSVGAAAAAGWQHLVPPSDRADDAVRPPPAPPPPTGLVPEDVAWRSAVDTRRRAIYAAAQAVQRARDSQSRVAELRATNDALNAAAGDYDDTAGSSSLFQQMSLRVADLLGDLKSAALHKKASDGCGLMTERNALDSQAERLGCQAQACLRQAIELVAEAANHLAQLREARRKRMAVASVALREEAAVENLRGCFESAEQRQLQLADGGAATERVAMEAAQCLRTCTADTAGALRGGSDWTDSQLQRALRRLHDEAARYWAELEEKTAVHERTAASAKSRADFAALLRAGGPGGTGPPPLHGHELRHAAEAGAAAAAALRHIQQEMDWVRAVADLHHIGETMSAAGSKCFLEEYDGRQDKAAASAHFAQLVDASRKASQALCDLADEPSPATAAHAAAFSALHSLAVVLGDGSSFGAHARRVGDRRDRTQHHRRTARALAQLRSAFSDCAAAQPQLCAQRRASAVDLQDGGAASSILELANATLGAADHAVSCIAAAAAGAPPLPPSAATGGTLRVLTIGAMGRRLRQLTPSRFRKMARRPAAEGAEVAHAVLADATVLSAESFGSVSGVHRWAVRCVAGDSDLMVGVSDSSLRVDGLCNAVRHRGCYFLNVSKGTLWSRSAGEDGSRYCDPLDIHSDPLVVVLDTDRATLRFEHAGADFGVAFADVALREPLHAAIEVAEDGAEIDFVSFGVARRASVAASSGEEDEEEEEEESEVISVRTGSQRTGRTGSARTFASRRTSAAGRSSPALGRLTLQIRD